MQRLVHVVLSVALILSTANALLAQSVVTVAGGGTVNGRHPFNVAAYASGIAVDGTEIFVRRGAQVFRIVEGVRVEVYAGAGIQEAVAGTGDGGVAAEATFGPGEDIAFDPAGNLHVAEGSAIRKIDRQTNIITTIAGTPDGDRGEDILAIEAGINPTTFTFDCTGNLYFTDGSHRVRVVDATTGRVRTLAGTDFTPGFTGDGGPAVSALLNGPAGIVAACSDGKPSAIYFKDTLNHVVRRIDLATKVIDTIAGTGERGYRDGSTSQAQFDFRGSCDTCVGNGIALDSAGRILVSDLSNGVVRRIDPSAGTVTTIAGNGLYFGTTPEVGDIALDQSGRLLVNVFESIFRIDFSSAAVVTVLGPGDNNPGDGGPARAASFFFPFEIEVDQNGGVFIGSIYSDKIRFVDPSTGRITSPIGGGVQPPADGILATDSYLGWASGITLDQRGDLVFASLESNQVWRVDKTSGLLRLIAGNGQRGYSGDGGQATGATLNLACMNPDGVFPMINMLAIDTNNDIFVSDCGNLVIRKIDHATGMISTYAGTGERGDDEGVAANEARFTNPSNLAFDSLGNLHVIDREPPGANNFTSGQVIKKIDRGTGVITRVVGQRSSEGASSPPAPALETFPSPILAFTFNSTDDMFLVMQGGPIMRVDHVSGILENLYGDESPFSNGDLGPAGRFRGTYVPDLEFRPGTADLYLLDQSSDRVRVVKECRSSIAPPTPTTPPNNTTGLRSSPILQWLPSPDAFSYDLYLDTGSASTLVASGLTATRFVPSNLLLGSTYSWRVVAKGDPYCPNPVDASSPTFTFSTEPACTAPPAPSLALPPNGGSVAGTFTSLQWAPSSGAGVYDVYFGTSPNPPFLQQVTGTSIQVSPLVPGTIYYWRVVARASCFSIYATSSLVASFTTGGSCPAPGTFGLASPASGTANVSLSPTLSWSASNGASSYDLYLGTTTPPQLFMPDIRATSASVTGLFPGRTYSWFVRARSACNSTQAIDSVTATFTTSTACTTPSATSITTSPLEPVAVGRSYVVSWSPAAGLDPGGLYEIQRSTTPGFVLDLESQTLESRTASFVADDNVTYYHRVRAIPACSEASASAFSPTVVVSTVSAGARVVFTSQPPAVLSSLGQPIENKRASFTLENIGDTPVTVRVSGSPIDTIRFFEVFDTFGGADPTVDLPPGSPRTFEIRFSGPRNDTPASYQGIILVEPQTPLEVVPYAFVNLKVGNEASATPEILVGGSPSEYAFFPGFPSTLPDTSREAITIEIRNPGTEPMEVGAEIGPDAWLVPEPGWNALPIPPGGTRQLRLTTDRTKALDGAPFPRYSYVTVRTRTGESARVLVQDNDSSRQGSLRAPLGGADDRAFIVPEVVSEGGRFSQVRLSNLGAAPAEATLYFTPRDADGFDPVRVVSARVLVPAGEVVALSDPLRLLFGLAGRGQLEVRAPDAAIGLLSVSASNVSATSPDRHLAEIPVLQRTEGATAGVRHVVPGVASNSATRTDLVLVETSGTEAMDALVSLVDSSGVRRGETRVRVPRYGMKLVADVAALLGGSGLGGSRLEILAAGGGGSLVALGKVVDRASGSAAILTGQAVASGGSLKSARMRRAYGLEPEAGGSTTIVIPFVSSGVVSPTSSTLVGLTSTLATPVSIEATFRPATGSGSASATIDLVAGGSAEFRDILAQLFNLAGNRLGSIEMTVPDGVRVFSRSLAAPVDGAPGGDNPAVAVGSELVTGFVTGANRALHLDGLSLAIDAAKMARWAVVIAEVGGFTGQVVVELREPGSIIPIRAQTLTVPARGALTLDSVFKALGLEGKNPKQLTNVRCTIRPVPGSRALFTAVGVQIDPLSGEARIVSFSPAGGVRPSGPSLAGTGELPPPPEVPDRRRPVRR